MSYKSYVTMEENVCVVCGTTFNTGNILMDRKLRAKFDRNTMTGWGVCPADQEKFDEGYIALVGCKNVPENNNLKPEDADRSGTVIYLKTNAFLNIFKVDVPKSNMCFIPETLADQLKEMSHDTI